MVTSWPWWRFAPGARVKPSTLLRKRTVSSDPPLLQYIPQYWQWQYRVKANLGIEWSSRGRGGSSRLELRQGFTRQDWQWQYRVKVNLCSIRVERRLRSRHDATKWELNFAVTRYCLHFKALLWESIILDCLPQPTKPSILQYYCGLTR